jgi:hypothetical protein
MAEAPPDYAERSQRILEAAGFEVLPLTRRIGDAWDLLGASPQGLVLVGLFMRADWPSFAGVNRYRCPSSFPPATRLLGHRWTPDADWPEVRTL